MANRDPIMLFDGHCHLCSGAVAFIIRRDPGKHFRFAALQSDAGRTLAGEAGMDPDALDTLILLEDGRAFDRSTAALRICRRLHRAWPFLYGFIILPRFIRDPVYNLVARNRYRWFGRRDTCLMPRPEWTDRFL